MSTIFCFVFVLRQREIEQKISGAAVFCLGHFATNKVPWNRLFYLSSRPARSFAIFTLDSFDAPCKVNKKVLEWINVKVKVHGISFSLKALKYRVQKVIKDFVGLEMV